MTVIVYDPQKDSCSTLPPYACHYFSMAVVNNQLILVGGRDSKVTNKLGVWDESSSMWTHPFPPMTTACSRPTTVTHKDRWLIVIGGSGGDNHRLSRVEILDTFSKQWHSSTPMPKSQGCTHTLTATIGSTCYLMGGYVYQYSAQKRVLSVPLDELVSQAQAVGGSSPPTPSISPWQILPDTPLQYSAPLALNGILLAVGGKSGKAMNTIYAYHAERKEWVKAGEMPTERARCSCIVLPSGEIMVVGTKELNPIAQQVHLATVL